MKKVLLAVLSISFVLCFAGFLNASVVPLAKDTSSVGSGTSGNGDQSCDEAGYTYTQSNCSNGLAVPCPTNGTYYKVCCPSGYKYTKAECAGTLSTDNCYGYYKCE